MKKLVLIFLAFTSLSSDLLGQFPQKYRYELKENLAKAIPDTTRLRLAFLLASGYRFANIDSSLLYTEMALSLARKINNRMAEGRIIGLKSATLLENGRLPESMKLAFEALRINQETLDTINRALTLNRIGNIYMELADYKKANEYYFRSRAICQDLNDNLYYNEMSNIGNVYELQKMADSALYFLKVVYDSSLKHPERTFITRSELMFRMGNAWKLNGDKPKALAFYKKGIEESNLSNDIRNLTMNNLFLARLYSELKLPDSCRKYAYAALQSANISSFRKGIYEACLTLYDFFTGTHKLDSANKYLIKANVERDYLFGTNQFKEMQRVILENQEMEERSRTEREKLQSQIKTNTLLGGLLTLSVIAVFLFRINTQRKKANLLLQEQKEKVEAGLRELKSAQSQLIQSEKMASLGELTAGIAHEIQNPLNFVNNFSEVNKELLDEMNQEIEKGNFEGVKAISKDVIENQEKINHHGKRADAIVKGMLQHSRSSNSQKELTDMNALCDEYLRLSYHGLRAKDKSFNSKIETDFDSSIPMINLIPQDVGRVILNLINNAFYAVNEKSKSNVPGYEPMIIVSTKNLNGKIEIRVKDNGTGIPKKVID